MDNPLLLLLRGIQTIGLGPTWAGVVHALRTRWVEAKFADPERPLRGLPVLAAFLRRIPVAPGAFPPPGPVAITPGPLLSIHREENALHCRFARASLTVAALAPDLIRVSWRPEAGAPPQSPAPAQEGAELRTNHLLCRVFPDGRIAILDGEGTVLAEEAAPIGWTAGSAPRSAAEWRPSDNVAGSAPRSAAERARPTTLLVVPHGAQRSGARPTTLLVVPHGAQRSGARPTTLLVVPHGAQRSGARPTTLLVVPHGAQRSGARPTTLLVVPHGAQRSGARPTTLLVVRHGAQRSGARPAPSCAGGSPPTPISTAWGSGPRRWTCAAASTSTGTPTPAPTAPAMTPSTSASPSC